MPSFRPRQISSVINPWQKLFAEEIMMSLSTATLHYTVIQEIIWYLPSSVPWFSALMAYPSHLGYGLSNQFSYSRTIKFLVTMHNHHIKTNDKTTCSHFTSWLKTNTIWKNVQCCSKDRTVLHTWKRRCVEHSWVQAVFSCNTTDYFLAYVSDIEYLTSSKSLTNFIISWTAMWTRITTQRMTMWQEQGL